jgi:ribonuclease BN (tRNA processing enzyme)
MRIIFLGTGFAVPSKERVQSGVLIETEKHKILMDCGSGVMGNLARAGYKTTDITHIFFSHHHLDHDIDFFPILKARMLFECPVLNVYGPVGTNEWAKNLFRAYPYLKEKVGLEIKELKEGEKLDFGDFSISCESTLHSPESLAYRIDSDASLIYSGDTEPCDGIKTLIGGGVDILIQECSLFDSYVEGHTNVKSLEEFLKGLPVKRLVLTHFSSEIIGREDEVVEILKRYFSGEITIGEDLFTQLLD